MLIACRFMAFLQTTVNPGRLGTKFQWAQRCTAGDTSQVEFGHSVNQIYQTWWLLVTLANWEASWIIVPTCWLLDSFPCEQLGISRPRQCHVPRFVQRGKSNARPCVASATPPSVLRFTAARPGCHCHFETAVMKGLPEINLPWLFLSCIHERAQGNYMQLLLFL